MSHILGESDAIEELARVDARFPLLRAEDVILFGAGPILVHLDADVIDFIDFPAADFPTINTGLKFEQTMECIDVFVRSPKFKGLTITEFNPDHVDQDDELVVTFVERLIRALTGMLSPTGQLPGICGPCGIAFEPLRGSDAHDRDAA